MPSSWITRIYLPLFLSSRHITVHNLSLLALWYWCNMHIQLLSFKIWCLWTIRIFIYCSKLKCDIVIFTFIIATVIGLITPHGQLYMRITSEFILHTSETAGDLGLGGESTKIIAHLQQRRCLVRLPRELYPKVHQHIINVTCIFVSCISM